MTLVIASKSDLGRVTRLLSSHPEAHYTTAAGEHGEIIVTVDRKL